MTDATASTSNETKKQKTGFYPLITLLAIHLFLFVLLPACLTVFLIRYPNVYDVPIAIGLAMGWSAWFVVRLSADLIAEMTRESILQANNSST